MASTKSISAFLNAMQCRKDVGDDGIANYFKTVEQEIKSICETESDIYWH